MYSKCFKLHAGGEKGFFFYPLSVDRPYCEDIDFWHSHFSVHVPAESFFLEAVFSVYHLSLWCSGAMLHDYIL